MWRFIYIFRATLVVALLTGPIVYTPSPVFANDSNNTSITSPVEKADEDGDVKKADDADDQNDKKNREIEKKERRIMRDKVISEVARKPEVGGRGQDERHTAAEQTPEPSSEPAPALTSENRHANIQQAPLPPPPTPPGYVEGIWFTPVEKAIEIPRVATSAPELTFTKQATNSDNAPSSMLMPAAGVALGIAAYIGDRVIRKRLDSEQ